MDNEIRRLERQGRAGDLDAIARLQSMSQSRPLVIDILYSMGHWPPPMSLMDIARQWTRWSWCDWPHPLKRSTDLIADIVAHTLQGRPFCGHWGNTQGDVVIEGLLFRLLPPREGLHRLKIKCPNCHKFFGPAKWRQHQGRSTCG